MEMKMPDPYTLSAHAVKQSRVKAFHEDAVLLAASDPHTSYENRRFPGQMRHIRDGIVAVVDPAARRVITVYENVKETELRPDQRDADALAYGARKSASTAAPRTAQQARPAQPTGPATLNDLAARFNRH
jgi:hypothetical protein